MAWRSYRIFFCRERMDLHELSYTKEKTPVASRSEQKDCAPHEDYRPPWQRSTPGEREALPGCLGGRIGRNDTLHAWWNRVCSQPCLLSPLWLYAGRSAGERLFHYLSCRTARVGTKAL